MNEKKDLKQIEPTEAIESAAEILMQKGLPERTSVYAAAMGYMRATKNKRK